ncbi:MAG: putative isoquinoline 1-oxidoreductase subunit beta IorB, molybdoprotein [Candidatus Sulfotelmatobacter sp.]|nr:putative isoquinoline 1-oxidoreductase subunit beta IorB, molybdoprotein [Candidatus Sulfotelmatobacter sp.]
MKKRISRRDFLRTTGALVVCFSAAACIDPLAIAQGPFDTHPSHIDPDKLDSWIAVASDGTVTAYTGKCDFGQGMYTVQTQLVAEELCIPIHKVKLVQCDTSVTPDQGTTSGSQSTPTNFNTRNLAQAAATAREALGGMAAQRLGVPADQLTIEDGVFSAKDGRHVSYGELIQGKHFNMAVNPAAKRRSPGEWKVLGKPVPSLDRVALMTGTFEFVHNVHVPGMLHGRVVRPPESGATVGSLDEKSVQHISGLIKIVVRNNFVGVVAEQQWQAAQAAKALKVIWKPGTGLPPQRNFYDHMRTQPSRDAMLVNSNDVDDKLKSASPVLGATYSHPYQAHGSIGSSCAVADVQADHATVWSATQSVYPTQHGVSTLIGLPLDGVRVVFVRGAGCYGLNAADTVSYDAALMSQAVGKPVRVQLTRQDEFISENYGSACVIEQRAVLDTNGAIEVWDCETWVASLGGRPGYEKPGNVITGMLAGFDPETITPRAAAEPAGELRNGNNAVPSYMRGCVNDKCAGAGSIRSERVLMHSVKSPFFTGPLRSPLRLQNTFAHECFMDEISAHAKADPVAYRLQHLRETRIIDVVKGAAKAANWDARPSPKPGAARTGKVTGRGIACVAYEGDNGYAALVAEVEVNQASGEVYAQRFVISHDCGPISNPDGLRNQIEGGILQGMSRALGEEITWDDRKVTSIDWESYNTLPLGIQVPAIECVLLERPSEKATGAGETAITLVAAAIGNAIFDATGARLREVPFTPERVKAALASRG